MAAAAAALAAAPPGSAGGALPYVCNWVAGTATPLSISVPNREYCQGIHVGFDKLVFWPN